MGPHSPATGHPGAIPAGRSWHRDDPRIWGVPVVLTTQIAVGTALAGDFANSTMAYIRDGIKIETSNQGSAQFTSNTCLIRCETRILLTAPRPSGLVKITGLV
jgi:Phage capsid family